MAAWELKMTLQTDNYRGRSAQRCHGFTLMELILVMALLVIVLGIAAPSLSRFFRSRNLDLEARRFLSLTHYGQSRAASEGVPMVLWINAQGATYGLQADITYTGNRNSSAANNDYAGIDSKAVEYPLDEKLQIEAEMPIVEKTSGQWWQTMSSGNGTANNNLMNAGQNNSQGNLPQIRFSPDGSIDENSPVRVLIREQQEKGVIVIAQSRNGLGYEIQSSTQQTTRR
jgi:prepilin-type N-terminal cleavage/methylation domain-containing protein